MTGKRDGTRNRPRFTDAEIHRIASQVAGVAESAGLGFVLARVVTDQIIEGVLSPDDPRFETDLVGNALDLLLGGPEEAFKSDRALLIALALTPTGLPLGRVWTAAASAIDAGCDASEHEQVSLVVRLARILIEERKGAQVRYRVFHDALRGPLQRAPVDPRGTPLDESELGDRADRLRSALVELVRSQTEDWRWPEQADPYLVDTLPTLLAAQADPSLISIATDGARLEERRPYSVALLKEAADALATGDASRALFRAQAARNVIGRYEEDPLFLDSVLAMCDALLAQDDWRNARDIARGELRLAWDRGPRPLSDPIQVGQVIRAARRLVRALGIGAFDAEEGLQILNVTLERLSAASASTLSPNAEHLADLLISYSDSLRMLSDPAALVAPLEGAALLLQAQVDKGRVDLKFNLAHALTHLGIALFGLGHPDGLELLRQSVAETAVYAPFIPAHMGQVTPVVGELVQHLGMTGLHREALEWLDWAIEAYRPAAEVHDQSASILVAALGMRSAVLAALSRNDEALRSAREALTRCAERGPQRTAAAGTLALRLLDQGLDEEAIGLATRKPVDSYYSDIGRPWWAEVARANLLTAAGQASEAVGILEYQLERMGRPAGPWEAGINFGTFVNFEPSLRVGIALAEAHAALGQNKLASEALARAALIFQEQRMPHAPSALLHVPGPILARYARGFFRSPNEASARETDEWLRALDALSQGGPRALEKLVLAESLPVDVRLRVSAGPAEAMPPTGGIRRTTPKDFSRAIPGIQNSVVSQLVQKSLPEHNRGAAMSGPDISEEEHEVTLHEERSVVEKETVPVERVRLDKDVVRDEQTVNEEVRKEHIDTDGTDDTRR